MEDDEKQPLDTLPIEWVEERVCAETFENRRSLRDGGWKWRPVPADPDTGMPSGLIEVPDPAVQQATMLARHADCLANSRDAWSDYMDPRHLPLDATGVPYWVHRRVQKWEEWNGKPGKAVEPGTAGKGVVAKSHAGKEPYLPTRCVHIKKDGTRCWAWCLDKTAEGRCNSHAPGHALAANMGHQIALAKVKVMQAMPAMADALEELALTASSEQVRLKAVTEMMDRGGVHAATEVNISGEVEGKDAAAIIREKLTDLGDRLKNAEVKREALEHAAEPTDVVDAVIVSDTEEAS